MLKVSGVQNPELTNAEPRVCRVVIAEELGLLRDAFAALCESAGSYLVVARCADGLQAFRAVLEHRPEALLLDHELPGLHALELIRRVRQLDPPPQCVLLSVRQDRKSVLEALRAGATAYVLKTGPGQHLLDALDQVRKGGVYLSPLLDLSSIFAPARKSPVEDPLESLSPREYQVFMMLVEGIRAKEIAARLELSPKTVDTYRASLMRKLGIHDVAGLVKFAIARRLLPEQQCKTA